MTRPFFSAFAAGVAAGLLLGACRDASQAPSDRPGAAPHQKDTPGGGSSVAPLDLVYVCGNKFLATNRTSMAVAVTYRVAETDETGELTLEPGFEDDPGFSETELETRQRGAVELYRNGQLVARRSNGESAAGLLVRGPDQSGVATLHAIRRQWETTDLDCNRSARLRRARRA